DLADRVGSAVGAPRAVDALEDGEDPAELFAQVAGRGDGSLEVYDVVRAPDGFHARKDAVSKTYVYCLWRRELGEDEAPRDTWSVGGVRDLPGMQRALDSLVGAHDFAAFATPAKFERASTVRTVTRADLYEDGPAVVLTFEADAFLHKMVRNLVRAVVRVGEGKWSHRWIADALAAGDREASPGSAPASGLTLAHVGYPFPLFGAKVDDASGAEHDAEPRA
ncbi:MAG: hypothetical protein AAFP22_14100, partial [Planctomycetota bacterium]